MTHGIDVSKHNGSINWNSVKDSGKVDFVVMRAGYGKLVSQKDPKFEEYYSACKKLGIPIGCYWYSYAKTIAEAQTEARVFLDVIRGKQFEFPVYLDLEEESQFRLGKNTCSAIAEAFLEIVEKAGYFVGIYSSKSGLENYIDASIRKKYSVWVAHVNVQKTSYSMPFDMWQYSWKGRIDGISGDVDCNYCYKDFPAIIKNAGLNGFPKIVEKPVETVENDVEAPAVKGTFTIEIEGRTFKGTLHEEN